MKLVTLQSILSMVILGAVAIVLAITHGGNSVAATPVQVEPQIVVMMPTPQPQPAAGVIEEAPTTTEPTSSVANDASVSTSTETLEVEVVEATVEVAEPTPLPVQAGALLRGNTTDIFYITENGTRQRVYNQETFAAFGFAEDEIIQVNQEDLETIPLAGDLTPLLQDQRGNLYWLSVGKLWSVETWQTVVGQAEYTGMPVTPLESTLQSRLPLASALSNGTLLREGDTVYYLLNDTIVPVMVGQHLVITTNTDGNPVISGDIAASLNESSIVDVPPGILSIYKQGDWLYQVIVNFNDETLAANLRQGPGLDQNVVKIISRDDGLLKAKTKTADGYWLYVTTQDAEGWLAIDLIEENTALNLLPVTHITNEATGNSAQVKPTATNQSWQPVYCHETPIRGFGKVWGDRLEVQRTLRCPTQYREQGTKAAVQNFQNGWMLWLESDSRYYNDPVYVFFNDGTYQRFGDLGAADPTKVGTTPAGFVEVGDKFSKVYWEGTGARVKERLGYATTQSRNSDGAYQQFNNGRMFWAGTVDRIFVIYDYWTRDENNNRIQVRTWASYEDKF